VNRCEPAEVILLAGSHLALILRAVHMVIAAEMKDAVDEQMGELIVERMGMLCRLPDCRLDTDGYVAKRRPLGDTHDKVVGLIGEGQDICRLIDTQERMVQTLHLLILSDEDSQFAAFLNALAMHHARREISQAAGIRALCVDSELNGNVVPVTHRRQPIDARILRPRSAQRR